VQVGDTVSLRLRGAAGSTEVVGTVLAASTDSLTLRRRDGAVIEIAVSEITAGRVVPPSPAQRVDVAELERIATLGWRPLEQEPLGEWLLRAGGGVTGRANSALAAGDPGQPVGAALTAVQQWYDARGRPPRVQLPAGAAPAGLVALIDDLGWTSSSPTHVMTAELGPVLRPTRGEAMVEVRLEASPDEPWLARWRADCDGVDADAARALMTNHPQVVFASIREGDRCVAIARVAVDGRWAGLFCVEVAPDARRRGLGRLVSLAPLRWAVAQGARRAYLQAADDNGAAVALYTGLGFTVHHDYVYRTRDAT
jgi:ribosomal protein S18 acetylase RimI-like enzyme